MIKTEDVIIKPVETEKSVGMAGKYTFQINPAANKNDVKNAVNTFYGVEVEKVSILKVKPKFRFFNRGQMTTKRSESKKAIVTLKDGKTLNFNDFK